MSILEDECSHLEHEYYYVEDEYMYFGDECQYLQVLSYTLKRSNTTPGR